MLEYFNRTYVTQVLKGFVYIKNNLIFTLVICDNSRLMNSFQSRWTLGCGQEPSRLQILRLRHFFFSNTQIISPVCSFLRSHIYRY